MGAGAVVLRSNSRAPDVTTRYIAQRESRVPSRSVKASDSEALGSSERDDKCTSWSATCVCHMTPGIVRMSTKMRCVQVPMSCVSQHGSHAAVSYKLMYGGTSIKCMWGWQHATHQEPAQGAAARKAAAQEEHA